MSNESITVWIEEEYGYKYWRWESNMTSAELVAWWKAMESVEPYFWSFDNVPGKMTEVTMDECPVLADDDKLWKAHVHEDCDSFLRQSDGTYVLHAGVYLNDRRKKEMQ
jgi:hypothetical protein